MRSDWKWRGVWCGAAALLAGTAVLAAGSKPPVSASDTEPPPAPALTGNRAPYRVALSPDGRRAYVTEWAEGTVAVIDADAGRVVERLRTGGREPTGLALSPDGQTLIVTNSGSASVALLEVGARGTSGGQAPLAPDGGRAARRPVVIPLPGMPFDVAVSPDGAAAYVAVSQLDQVTVIDLRERQVAARIDVGRRPRALALTADGRTLVCANMAGSVSVIDAEARREVSRAPIPAVNLRGIAVSADGRRAYVTGQRAQNERPTETAVGIWSNQLFGLALGAGRAAIRENLWLDMAGEGVADPDAVALGERVAYVSFAGSHAVGALPLGGGVEISARARPGAGPRGLALSPDGTQLWVASHLGNTVSILDARTLATVKTISLGRASRVDPNLYGRFLFESASLARGGQFSCNSCHPDGHTDGIDWEFVHVNDGVKRRNVRSLRGHLAATAPFRWSGLEHDLPEFVQNEVTGLLQGPPLKERELKALARFCERLPLPPNPYRTPEGRLTPAGERGKALFHGKAGCVECHAGPHYGGTGLRAWVGTTPPDLPLDVPHLSGVYDSGPYLHDGRAATLEEVFSRYNSQGRHGRAAALTEEELRDLLQFVREL